MSRKVTQSGKENQFLTIHYQYDATGNRVQKTVSRNNFTTITHYVRDATGNILATYKETKIEEFHIYGSSRLGTLNLQYDTTNQLQNDQGKLILGYRNYELTNHLGNVLAVISDKKILLDSIFQADVISTNDYYPFGMTIQSRSFVSETYRFSFNGQERDTEININIHHAEFWKYDARTARRWNTDPVFVPFESPYATFRNNPIIFIDPAGNMPINGGNDEGNYMKKRDYINILNKIATQLHHKLNDMYKNSFFEKEYVEGTGVMRKHVKEHGALIVQHNEQSFSLENPTEGPEHVVNEAQNANGTMWYGVAGRPSVSINWDYQGEGIVIGDIHTHPHVSGHGGAHSDLDIEIFFKRSYRFFWKYRTKRKKPLYFKMVEAGDYRYVIVVENFRKIYDYLRGDDSSYQISDQKIKAMVKELYQKTSHHGKKRNEATLEKLQSVVGDSSKTGIGLYKTKEGDKTQFEKVN